MPRSTAAGWWRRWPVVLTACVLVALGQSPVARAHAFLVRTDPGQGARLPTLPRSVTVEFSEAVTAPRLTLRLGPSGPPRSLLVQGAGGRILRADLSPSGDGIYLISWGAVGVDGDEVQGEFAFAVGRVQGTLPAARGTGPGPDPVRVATGWLFFVGLALAAGGWGMGRSVTPSAPGRPPGWPAGVRPGLAAALVGAAGAWSEAVGGFAGPQGPVRQRVLLAAVVILLAAALLVCRRRWRPWLVAGLVGGAAVSWSARGHSAVTNGLLGGALDVVHLLAGAAWVGALVLLVGDVWRSWRRGDEGVLARARGYARLAVVLVVVLAAAGLGSALLLLGRPADLWSTGYGRLLMAKSSLFLIALGLAVAGRRRGLHPGGLGLLRRSTPVEAGVLGGVLVLSSVLVTTAPPAPALTAGSLLGPPPMTGPVARDAGMAGFLTVAVTAGEDQIQVELFRPGGSAAGSRARLDARFPDGRHIRLTPRPCGPGCFAQHLTLPSGRTALEVTASAPGWEGGTYVAELDWPPLPEDPALLTRLVATMRAAPVVVVTESTSSGPGLSLPAGTFSPISGEAFLALEPYAAGSADDIRPLSPDGGAFRLYIPGERIWVTLWVDRAGRLARERIVSINHVIERTFRYSS